MLLQMSLICSLYTVSLLGTRMNYAKTAELTKMHLRVCARSSCLPKGLYVLRRVWDVDEYISVDVSQILTKFNERVG